MEVAYHFPSLYGKEIKQADSPKAAMSLFTL